MKKVPCLAIRLCWIVVLLVMATAVSAERFTYYPPGDLIPGSGQGREDYTVYMPQMRFPVEAAPAYANSQYYGVGGRGGPPGSWCDQRNYSYPWRDNFCESRTWSMPLCPAGVGHQGQDIRGATCEDNKWWTVAAEAGTITIIGPYSVYLQGDSGIRHRYLHLKKFSLAVKKDDRVRKGQRIGKISNEFSGTPTTYHLHFDMYSGGRYIPPYMSLVASYRQLLGANFNTDVIAPLLLED